jgi:hypothetical protein
MHAFNVPGMFGNFGAAELHIFKIAVASKGIILRELFCTLSDANPASHISSCQYARDISPRTLALNILNIS